MSCIHVLPVHLRNKIAAGEVIERPASVVKELVENAIDAGGTDIRVEVLAGGKRLIRVSDNGAGMDRDDALLCLERHATSKIGSEDDLFRITTLGFRGEALPSIAAVSKMRVVTGLAGAPSGVSINVSGGEVREVREAACAGTTMEVRDLFFNTPARRKFLKTNNTELFHIIDTVTREALSHHTLSFMLRTDHHETMLLPGAAGLKERILQVYGDEFVKGLIEVRAEGPDMEMTAYVSGAGNFRKGRDHQFLFVNGRPVKDASVAHALYQAYEGALPHDRNPVYFIFLTAAPEKVDFNVHPTKREIRFQEKETVYRFVLGGVREAIRDERTEAAAEYAPDFTAGSGAERPTTVATPPASPFGDAVVAEPIGLDYMPSIPFVYLGDTFIALSGKGGLTLVDHHAAHERILYEKFLKKIDLGTHPLLFPQQVGLSEKEHRVIVGHKSSLAEFGIEIDDFGNRSIIVRSLPTALDGADIRGVLADVASALLEGIPPGKSLKEAVAARIACHASVRGRQILNQEEIARLLTDLDKAENPGVCPHGRPTRLFYSLDDLKRMFKRK